MAGAAPGTPPRGVGAHHLAGGSAPPDFKWAYIASIALVEVRMQRHKARIKPAEGQERCRNAGRWSPRYGATWWTHLRPRGCRPCRHAVVHRHQRITAAADDDGGLATQVAVEYHFGNAGTHGVALRLGGVLLAVSARPSPSPRRSPARAGTGRCPGQSQPRRWMATPQTATTSPRPPNRCRPRTPACRWKCRWP